MLPFRSLNRSVFKPAINGNVAPRHTLTTALFEKEQEKANTLNSSLLDNKKRQLLGKKKTSKKCTEIFQCCQIYQIYGKLVKNDLNDDRFSCICPEWIAGKKIKFLEVHLTQYLLS